MDVASRRKDAITGMVYYVRLVLNFKYVIWRCRITRRCDVDVVGYDDAVRPAERIKTSWRYARTPENASEREVG